MPLTGLLSDTHSYLDPQVFTYFENVDEIGHASDFGSAESSVAPTNYTDYPIISKTG